MKQRMIWCLTQVVINVHFHIHISREIPVHLFLSVVIVLFLTYHTNPQRIGSHCSFQNSSSSPHTLQPALDGPGTCQSVLTSGRAFALNGFLALKDFERTELFVPSRKKSLAILHILLILISSSSSFFSIVCCFCRTLHFLQLASDLGAFYTWRLYRRWLKFIALLLSIYQFTNYKLKLGHLNP